MNLEFNIVLFRLRSVNGKSSSPAQRVGWSVIINGVKSLQSLRKQKITANFACWSKIRIKVFSNFN